MKRRIADPPSPLDDPRFQEQRRAFALALGCEACSYFLPRAGACAHGYPNATHRAAAFEPGAAPAGSFCKEFELA